MIRKNPKDGSLVLRGVGESFFSAKSCKWEQSDFEDLLRLKMARPSLPNSLPKNNQKCPPPRAFVDSFGYHLPPEWPPPSTPHSPVNKNTMRKRAQPLGQARVLFMDTFSEARRRHSPRHTDSK